MIVSRLELVDFRNYARAAFDFHPGTTAVVGLNGQGKTNLAEAMAYLATLDSSVTKNEMCQFEGIYYPTPDSASITSCAPLRKSGSFARSAS